ncbi:hemerythrin family protein [Helicobacter cappadocius]|uniref:Hemerythrin family protein n=1 Tax=Helicobacter cappadocius TaxID=3063998 RepID=A0AA90PIK7_9HELI|nr:MULTISPECIES: hemerythrin family protein [unclassified Helicobacter]MDO7252634.1 hemerythrin family protein [Helicobacter sp. faydin-H75]MDP2538501.1 hemerythrin family protein [Helicobacter sp. faydin-H76]
MLLPKWEEGYSVDNEMIDMQHKKLFDLAQKAYLMVNHSVSKDEIKEVLREFFEYMRDHFKDEEDYMISIGYPRLDEHKRLHRQIIADFSECVKEIHSANDLKEKIGVIAKEWLLQHILKEDMLIRRYCKERMFVQRDLGISVEKYEYICSCKGKIHEVPPNIHEKIQHQNAKFICRFCKQILRLKH